jgi:hypothetical protein
MSLLEYESSVPWAESMRLELISGHMPPWGVEGTSSRFLNVHPLSGHELNVLLTWAAGGTPRGAGAAAPAPEAPDWALGPPDLVLRPQTDFTMAADVQEHVATFTFDVSAPVTRWIRAVDVMPGAPGIVRSATLTVGSPPADAGTLAIERRLALWLPGDAPVPAHDGAGFLLPADAHLTLSVRYRKTWMNERDVISDRSRVGLYFADAPRADVRAIDLTPSAADLAAMEPGGVLTFSREVGEDVQALALYPDPALHDAGVTIHAARPDGTREELMAFRPLPDWARRYWYRDPVFLPAGTALQVRVAFDAAGGLLAPGVPPRPPMNPADARLTLNVVPAR